MSFPHSGHMPDVGPFQVTVFDRGNGQWVKVLCASGLFDFQVWRGRLNHGDLWLLLHRLETGAAFASPFRFRAKVPVPFNDVHPNMGAERRFLTLHRDGVEQLVLYCLTSSIPEPLRVALVQAWSYDPADAQGETHEGHRQELRRDPEGAPGAQSGQGGQHGQGPEPDLDEAARRLGRGHRREVTPPRRRLNKYTMGTIPEEIREEVLAELARPEIQALHNQKARIYQATYIVRKRRGDLKGMGIGRVKGVRKSDARKRQRTEVVSHG